MNHGSLLCGVECDDSLTCGPEQNRYDRIMCISCGQFKIRNRTCIECHLCDDCCRCVCDLAYLL